MTTTPVERRVEDLWLLGLVDAAAMPRVATLLRREADGGFDARLGAAELDTVRVGLWLIDRMVRQESCRDLRLMLLQWVDKGRILDGAGARRLAERMEPPR